MSKQAKTSGPPAIALYGVSVAIVIALIVGMGFVFAPAKDTLKTDIPEDAGEGYVFQIEDGSDFPGWGTIRVEGELIQVVRVDEDKKPVNSGARLRQGENQHRFMIQKRGLVDTEGTKTPVYAHRAGKEVADTGTMFFPENNATYGKSIDDLFFLILYITAIAFVLTEAFLLFCIFRFRNSNEADQTPATYTHGNHKLEIFWTSGTAAFLLFLAIAQSKQWSEIKVAMPAIDDPNTVVVQVVARQFEWNFRQVGLDGRFGTPDDITTTGELTVPVGKKIRFQLRSQDVIHSLFLPNFRFKQDVVPGLNTPGWIQAERSGDFQIMCAEFCGILHTSMGGKLYVKEQAEFDAWVTEQSNFWAGENDGSAPSEWWGEAGKFWHWWDTYDLPSASFDRAAKSAN